MILEDLLQMVDRARLRARKRRARARKCICPKPLPPPKPELKVALVPIPEEEGEKSVEIIKEVKHSEMYKFMLELVVGIVNNINNATTI